MLPSKGEITAPWGVPTFVSFHSPSSDTPAFNHFWIRRITRRSAIRCSTNFTSHSCLMLSKETTTHYPPSGLPGASDDHPPTSSLRRTVSGGPPARAHARQFAVRSHSSRREQVANSAEWTDFNATAGPPPNLQLVGSLEDVRRLRSLVDAFLRRSADVPVTSGADQESHGATESELYRHPHSGDVPVGAVRRRAKTDCHPNSGASSCPSHPRPAPGADQ